VTKLTVLLDIDNTILATDSLRKHIESRLEANYGAKALEHFYKIQEQELTKRGFYDWKQIAMKFAKSQGSSDYATVLAVFLEAPFNDYWRPGAKDLIEFLKISSYLVIFSDGDEVFQKTKAEKLGLFEASGEVIISKSKVGLLAGIRDKSSGTVVIIDDKPGVILKAKEVIPDGITIWVKYGRYAKEEKSLGASLETENLLEVKDYIQKLQ